jgi:general secretion pathway protein D
LVWSSGLALLPGCSSPSLPVGGAHLAPAPGVKGTAPAFSDAPPMPAPPKPNARQELYSVVMQNVDVQELLFALARDAKLNVDIHPSIAGTVTMNVHDQTLAEILDRVARQVDLRYEIKGSSLSILPDTPYLMHYRVDYPNIRRDAKTTISTSTDVASTGGAPGAAGAGASASASNGSTSSIENFSNNRFWDTLLANLKDLLRETDKVLPDGTSETITEQAGTQSTTGTGAAPGYATATAGRRVPVRKPSTAAAILAASPNPAVLATAGSTIVRRNTFREAAYVVSSPETGNISVRASQNQHEKVREFLDRVLSSARRQVLIEATIVEVDLSSRYQQGINWSLLQTAGKGAGSRIDLAPAGPGTGLQTGGLVSSLANLTLKQTGLFGGNTDLSAMLSLMESFGTLRVLSSPKISVLNNQTSVLKVVDNKVYFTLNVTPATYSNGVLTAAATYSTTINTVPIGFLMTVVPQVSESNEVTLTLRPTISRITGYATDPNPALSQYNIVNRIPEVQTREMESVLRVQSGDIAVLGGLMQDTRNDGSDEVPGLNRVPILSNFFKFRNDSSQKSELVIFLRPTVLYDASLAGDFRDFRSSLSEARQSLEARPQPLRSDKALQRD